MKQLCLILKIHKALSAVAVRVPLIWSCLSITPMTWSSKEAPGPLTLSGGLQITRTVTSLSQKTVKMDTVSGY